MVFNDNTTECGVLIHLLKVASCSQIRSKYTLIRDNNGIGENISKGSKSSTGVTKHHICFEKSDNNYEYNQDQFTSLLEQRQLFTHHYRSTIHSKTHFVCGVTPSSNTSSHPTNARKNNLEYICIIIPTTLAHNGPRNCQRTRDFPNSV